MTAAPFTLAQAARLYADMPLELKQEFSDQATFVRVLQWFEGVHNIGAIPAALPSAAWCASVDAELADTAETDSLDNERDAARYRWLRNPDRDVGLVLDKVVGYEPVGPLGTGGYSLYEYRAGSELDAAIDSAMCSPEPATPLPAAAIAEGMDELSDAEIDACWPTAFGLPLEGPKRVQLLKFARAVEAFSKMHTHQPEGAA